MSPSPIYWSKATALANCFKCPDTTCDRTIELGYYLGCADLTPTNSTTWDTMWPNLTCALYDRATSREVVNETYTITETVEYNLPPTPDTIDVTFDERNTVIDQSVTIDLLDLAEEDNLFDLQKNSSITVSGGGSIEEIEREAVICTDINTGEETASVNVRGGRLTSWTYYMAGSNARVDVVDERYDYVFTDTSTPTTSCGEWVLDNTVTNNATYEILHSPTAGNAFNIIANLIAGGGGFTNLFERVFLIPPFSSPADPPNTTYSYPTATVPTWTGIRTRVDSNTTLGFNRVTEETWNNSYTYTASRILPNSYQARYTDTAYVNVPVSGDINTDDGVTVTKFADISTTINSPEPDLSYSYSPIETFPYQTESCITFTNIDHNCLPDNSAIISQKF